MKKKSIKKIILTGGGESKHFRQVDLIFKSWLPPRCNILLIPVATNRRNHAYSLKRIKQTFKVLNFNNVAVCNDLSTLTWEFLSLFHAVYIDGGNTFTLMSELKINKTKKLLAKFTDNGGIINGDSAGAIVLGKKVDSAYFGEIADRNIAKLKDYNGLNFLSQWYVHCHYDESENPEIKAYVKTGKRLLALADDTAIAMEGDKVVVTGKGSLHLFSGQKYVEVKPGKKIQLSSVF
jgi:dipeptidase E